MGKSKMTGIRGRLFNIKIISLPVKKKIVLKKLQKGAPFCIRAKASYMAELAVALPFFTGFMMLLLFFFQILTVQQEVESALLAAARKIAALECQTEDAQEAGILTAKMLLIRNIPKDSAAEYFIRGGRGHIALSHSELSGNYVLLQADYKVRLLFGLFGRQEVAVTQRVKCRKWTGGGNGRDAEEEIVFITPEGTVFHRKRECSYLKPSVISVNRSQIHALRNAGGGKYYSCVTCMKNKNRDNMTVYITKYGNRYHGEKNCSRIKRTVFAVRLSEVNGKRGCSKCGKG